LKPKNEFTRSLVVDKDTWERSMLYARSRYNMSLSKVIEQLLNQWLEKESKKPLENPKQSKIIH
jgi:endonuclease I